MRLEAESVDVGEADGVGNRREIDVSKHARVSARRGTPVALAPQMVLLPVVLTLAVAILPLGLVEILLGSGRLGKRGGKVWRGGEANACGREGGRDGDGDGERRRGRDLCRRVDRAEGRGRRVEVLDGEACRVEPLLHRGATRPSASATGGGGYAEPSGGRTGSSPADDRSRRSQTGLAGAEALVAAAVVDGGRLGFGGARHVRRGAALAATGCGAGGAERRRGDKGRQPAGGEGRCGGEDRARKREVGSRRG